jgi:hypothetical protein
VSADTVAAAVSALISLACTAILGARLAAGRGSRPPLISWTVGFALFTIASGCLWKGAASGWSEDVYRLYYLCGAILVVPFLAVGELLLVAPGRRPTRLAAATMLWLVFAATAAVVAADVDTSALRSAAAAPPNGAIGGPWTTILAVAVNSAGTVVLLGGSLLSARRRRDPRPLLVAAGVAVIAAASTATRADVYALFVLGQALGIALILAGLVSRRSRQARHAARASPERAAGRP